MKNILAITLSFALLLGIYIPNSFIYANESIRDFSTEDAGDSLKNFIYEELSYEDYVDALAKSEGISVVAATARVNKLTRGNARAATYGRFTNVYSIYPDISTNLTDFCIQYGVLATWYSPSYNEPWSSRKWMTIHSTLVEPGNQVKNFTCYTKSATISSNYIINFYASVKFSVMMRPSKSAVIETVFAI